MKFRYKFLISLSFKFAAVISCVNVGIEEIYKIHWINELLFGELDGTILLQVLFSSSEISS